VALANGSRDDFLAARPYVTFRRVRFDGLDLSVAVSLQAWFDRCSFVGVDLRHATLDGCSLKLGDLQRADLRGASLRFARFSGSDLREADLRDCDLTGAVFGLVNTGNDANAFTDVSGARWTLSGARRATFVSVVGAPG
jgi:uncharacterized protein YjbI with pentapeptide repeats